MEMQRKGTSTYRLSMGVLCVSRWRLIELYTYYLSALWCWWAWLSINYQLNVDLHTICLEEINIIFCILLGYYNASCSLHVLYQGSHHSCWKQVWPALWELNGNHSSHYEPVFWDRDVCWGAPLCFVFLMIVHRYTQIVNHLFTMITGFLHMPDCMTSTLIKPSLKLFLCFSL